MVAAAVVGAAAVGAAGSAVASSNAAGAQKDAANSAAQQAQSAQDRLYNNQNPYMQVGYSALDRYNDMIANGSLTPTFQFQPTMAQLEQTPGYQFALNQGLKGVQNSAAARGLGYSGAQIKGAEGFASGLASQTYQQQYQNALNNFNTNYQVTQNNANRLAGLVSLGQNAAAGVGNQGIQTASNIGNQLVGAGNAQAAGYIGIGNALSGGINNAATGYYLNNALNGGGQSSLYGANTATTNPVDLSSPKPTSYLE